MHRERVADKAWARLLKKPCNVERKSTHGFVMGGASPSTGSGIRGACRISSSQATYPLDSVSKNTAEGVIKCAGCKDRVRCCVRDCDHELLHVMGCMSSETRHLQSFKVCILFT